MKKIFPALIIILFLLACKKTKFSPEGPTDVRVKNISTEIFNEVIVNTSGGQDTLGNVSAGTFSEYKRFDKAFPKAEISAKINGLEYSTGEVDYYGLTYIGQSKITYEVWISNNTTRKLEMRVLYPLDGPLE